MDPLNLEYCHINNTVQNHPHRRRRLECVNNLAKVRDAQVVVVRVQEKDTMQIVHNIEILLLLLSYIIHTAYKQWQLHPGSQV